VFVLGEYIVAWLSWESSCFFRSCGYVVSKNLRFKIHITFLLGTRAVHVSSQLCRKLRSGQLWF
jgi:hypothetical protein